MRLLITLIRRYPVQSTFTLVALLFAGIAEGFGMSMLLPLLGIAIDTPSGSAVSSHVSKSALEQTITGFFGTIGMTPTVGLLLIIFVLSILLKAVMVLIANKLQLAGNIMSISRSVDSPMLLPRRPADLPMLTCMASGQ